MKANIQARELKLKLRTAHAHKTTLHRIKHTRNRQQSYTQTRTNTHKHHRAPTPLPSRRHTHLVQHGGVEDGSPGRGGEGAGVCGDGCAEGGGEGQAVRRVEGATHVRYHQLRDAHDQRVNTLVEAQGFRSAAGRDAHGEQLMSRSS